MTTKAIAGPLSVGAVTSTACSDSEIVELALETPEPLIALERDEIFMHHRLLWMDRETEFAHILRAGTAIQSCPLCVGEQFGDVVGQDGITPKKADNSLPSSSRSPQPGSYL